MDRKISTQDVTWFLDINRKRQLDLEPPYQRRSVWTRKDRQYFLDTIFRNYPSPPIFLHRTISQEGIPTFHVVDGKQRLETIIQFSEDKIRLAKDFGDSRLDGHSWSEIGRESELKILFWNYQITVESLDTSAELHELEGRTINDVFDRLNRNSRRLTRQELRHAKFEGWFIKTVESEAEKGEWQTLNVVTIARAKRMADSQFISELLMVILEERIVGFDQDAIDDFYATYDDPSEVSGFSDEHFQQGLERVKRFMINLQKKNSSVTKYARGVGNFYTLWCVVALTVPDIKLDRLASRYTSFMTLVEELGTQADLENFSKKLPAKKYELPLKYFLSAKGASTEEKQRKERFDALTQFLEK